jgi:hypothetical protein
VTTQAPVNPTIQMDPLTKLVRTDLPADVQRLKGKLLPPEQLQGEMTGTVMFHQRSLGEHMIQIRDWAAQYLFGMTAHLESIEDRLEELESEGVAQSTQIEQDDADNMLKYIAGSNALLVELQKTQVDPEAKLKLQELINLGSTCEEMIRANVLIEVPDDDDEESGEGEGGEEETEDAEDEGPPEPAK